MTSMKSLIIRARTLRADFFLNAVSTASALSLALVATACGSDSGTDGSGNGAATQPDASAGASSGGTNVSGSGAASGSNAGGTTLGGGGTSATAGGNSGTSAGGRQSRGGTNAGGVGPSAGGAVIAGSPGAGGATIGTGGSPGTLSDGGCIALGSPCDPNTSICCSNDICVSSTSPDYAGCRQPCTTAADCASGCCIPFANLPNKGFCGAALLCQCAGQDETCGGTRHCCSGFACSTFDSTGALACHKSCTQNSDCTTNCCVKVTGTADSVCLTPNFCGH